MGDYSLASKVTLGGQTIIDLTHDTVTSSNLLDGQTAHDKSGKQITGSMSPVEVTVSGGTVSKISGTTDDYLLTLS